MGQVLRWFLPAGWVKAPARCAAAGGTEAEIISRRKGEIALAELDRLRAAGVRFGLVLSDAGYGVSTAFGHGLDGRGLRWAVGIPRAQMVYGADLALTPPTGRRPAPGRIRSLRRRQRCWPSGLGGGSPGGTAQRGPWPPGSLPCGGCVGGGPTFANNRHLPGEGWAVKWSDVLVGGWRSNGERKYDLSDLPPRTSQFRCAASNIAPPRSAHSARPKLSVMPLGPTISPICPSD